MGGGGGVLPYLCYIGMCGAKGHDFGAVSVRRMVCALLSAIR